MNTTRRRGRPPQSTAAKIAPAPAVLGDIEPAYSADQLVESSPIAEPRRRRASVGGHALKLGAKGREGYSRRWFNDDNNRLAEAQELGYDFVTDESIQSTDSGSRVSRLVGTKKNGEPLRAYLLETPDELYAEGVAEKEAENARRLEEATVTSATPWSERYGEVTIGRR